MTLQVMVVRKAAGREPDGLSAALRLSELSGARGL
jgi:hypothetical protein